MNQCKALISAWLPTECRGMVLRLPSPRGPGVDLAARSTLRRTSHEQ